MSEQRDVVERLEARTTHHLGPDGRARVDPLCREAAAEIRALVKALEEIAAQVNDRWDDHCGHLANYDEGPDRPHEPTCPYDIARRALEAHRREDR